MAIDLIRTLQGTAGPLPLLTAALHAHAARAPDTQVYSSPAAFEAFIRGGGNVPLYERVSAELARHYTPDTRSLLDIGCGDGHALFPALAQAHQPLALERQTLVEPASALLASAVARAQAAGQLAAMEVDEVELGKRGAHRGPPEWADLRILRGARSPGYAGRLVRRGRAPPAVGHGRAAGAARIAPDAAATAVMQGTGKASRMQPPAVYGEPRARRECTECWNC